MKSEIPNKIRAYKEKLLKEMLDECTQEQIDRSSRVFNPIDMLDDDSLDNALRLTEATINDNRRFK